MGRIPAVDGLRYFAALLVVGIHKGLAFHVGYFGVEISSGTPIMNIGKRPS